MKYSTCYVVVVMVVLSSFGGVHALMPLQLPLPTIREAGYSVVVQNTSARPGDLNHSIPVYAEWNDSIQTYEAVVVFDPSDLALVTVSVEDGVGTNGTLDWSSGPPGTLSVSVTSLNLTRGQGLLFKILVDVLPDAGSGPSPVLLNQSGTFFMDLAGTRHDPELSDGHVMVITGNQPPSVPIISGPLAGGVGFPLNFTVLCDDIDGDSVSYLFDWADGQNASWNGPWNASQPVTFTHAWSVEGSYLVRVKARDATGESNWSEATSVSIARQIALTNLVPGYIYFFMRSYLYTYSLEYFESAVVLTTEDLVVNLSATSAVASITAVATKLRAGNATAASDANGTNGFSVTLPLQRGMYRFTVTAYDASGTAIDEEHLTFLALLRFGPPM